MTLPAPFARGQTGGRPLPVRDLVVLQELPPHVLAGRDPAQHEERDQAADEAQLLNELKATGSGTVKKIYVGEGDAVGKNQLLIEFE